MHPTSTSLAGVVAFLLSSAFSAELKVNYYSDGGCSDYMVSLSPGNS